MLNVELLTSLIFNFNFPFPPRRPRYLFPMAAQNHRGHQSLACRLLFPALALVLPPLTTSRHLRQHSPIRSNDQTRRSHHSMHRHSSLACNLPSLQTSSPASATPSQTVYVMHMHAENSPKWHKHACKAQQRAEKNSCVGQVCSCAMRCASSHRKRPTLLPPPLRRRLDTRAQSHAERQCQRLSPLPPRRTGVRYFARYVRTRRSCASIPLKKSARPHSSHRG
jgi:hypothetical protein